MLTSMSINVLVSDVHFFVTIFKTLKFDFTLLIIKKGTFSFWGSHTEPEVTPFVLSAKLTFTIFLTKFDHSFPHFLSSSPFSAWRQLSGKGCSGSLHDDQGISPRQQCGSRNGGLPSALLRGCDHALGYQCPACPPALPASPTMARSKRKDDSVKSSLVIPQRAPHMSRRTSRLSSPFDGRAKSALNCSPCPEGAPFPVGVSKGSQLKTWHSTRSSRTGGSGQLSWSAPLDCLPCTWEWLARGLWHLL